MTMDKLSTKDFYKMENMMERVSMRFFELKFYNFTDLKVFYITAMDKLCTKVSSSKTNMMEKVVNF